MSSLGKALFLFLAILAGLLVVRLSCVKPHDRQELSIAKAGKPQAQAETVVDLSELGDEASGRAASRLDGTAGDPKLEVLRPGAQAGSETGESGWDGRGQRPEQTSSSHPRIFGSLHSEVGEIGGRRVLLVGPFGAGIVRRETVTDQAGRFKFAGLEEGTYGLGLDEAPSVRPVFETVDVPPAGDIHMILGGPPENVVELVGTVTCAGEPVANVHVARDVQLDFTGLPREARTDEHGRYRLSVDRPGSHRFLVTRHGRFHYRFTKQVPDLPKATVDFELYSGRVQGRVLRENGNPSAGAQIRLKLLSEPQDPTLQKLLWEGHADQEGRYQFSGLSPGVYQIMASDRAEVAESRELALIPEFKSTGDEVVQDIELRPPAIIMATIRDSEGAVVEGSRLIFEDEGGHSLYLQHYISHAGVDGRITGKVPAGRYLIRAVHKDAQSLRRFVELTSNTPSHVELTIQR